MFVIIHQSQYEDSYVCDSGLGYRWSHKKKYIVEFKKQEDAEAVLNKMPKLRYNGRQKIIPLAHLVGHNP